MGADGAEYGIAKSVEEADARMEEGGTTEEATGSASSQLDSTIEQNGPGKDLIDSTALSLDVPGALNTAPAHLQEMQQNIPIETAHPTQVRPIDDIIAADITADKKAIVASAEDQPELDASEDYGDEDGGVIRCICECDDDDGFTIQCDRCLVWQHCACFGMSQASVPEEYHCEKCNPRPVDVEFAKAHQQKRKEAEARKASIERSIRRHNQNTVAASAVISDSVGIDGNQPNLPTEVDKGQQSGSGGISRSRKPSQQLDLSNVNFASVDGPPSVGATPGSSRSYKRRGGAPKTGPRKPSMVDLPVNMSMTPRTAAMMSSTGSALNTPAIGRADDRMDLDDTMAERMEAWQVEYTPTSANIIADQSTLASLMSVMADYEHITPLKAERGTGNRVIAPVIGRKVKVPSQVGDSIKEAPLPITDHGLTPIGNECVPVEVDMATLSDCNQRTYVKLISEMASASIFNSLLQVTPLPSEPQRPWSANRAFSKPVMHGLFADVSIPAGCFISEFNGEIDSADAYRSDPVNQYQSIGTTKPGVHLFPPPLNICIDARRFGNTTRFARFSCHPNAVVRPIILQPSKQGSRATSPQSRAGRSSFARFGLFAVTDIPRTHEITLGWEWDDAHIVHLLPLLVRDPMLGMLQSVRTSSSVVHSSGNQRLLERERRHVAIAALVEKGDFPYAGLLFTQKMNSILTVLLGSCLCACIGSAPAPSSHGGGLHSSSSSSTTASSNNMKRQDCAISQMLRLSQGMSLLNVSVTGSSNMTGSRRTRIKAPDFEPLVGKRRWWRPNAMPLTPTSIPDDQRDNLGADRKEDDFYRKLRVPYKLLPGGKVGRVEEGDFDNAMERKRMEMLHQKDINMEQDEEGSEGQDNSDVESDDSALTIPLGHDSELDDVEEDEDDSLLLQDGNVTIAKQEGGASYLKRTALPPKKRVSGTRLKAVNSAGEDSDVEYKGRKRRKENQKEKKGSRSKVAPESQKMGKKKKRKVYEPSSPLTSAPSQENSDESDDSQDEEEDEEEDSQDDTPTPQQQSRAKNTVKREGGIEGEGGSEAKRGKKGDMEARKKILLAKKRRQELMGDLENDSETSSGYEANRMDVEVPQERRKMSSPSKKQARKKAIKQVLQSDESEVGEEPTVQREATPAPIAEAEAAFVTLPEVAPPVVAPPPVIEMPKAKLSLAEYKKRLAERRTTSMNSQSNTSTPLPTPGLAMASPEKMSLPNTPSATTGQMAYAFPTTSSFASEPATVTTAIMTPTIIKSEFAPPAPRFPRPMTPPRDAAVESSYPTPRSISAGAATAKSPDISPVAARTLEAQRKPISTVQQYTQGSSPLAKPSNIVSIGPTLNVVINSSEKALPSPIVATQSMDLGTADASRIEAKIPPANDVQTALALAVRDAREAETSLPAAGRTNRAYSLSKSDVDYAAPGANKSTTESSFNPPKAPRALINPAAPGLVSSATSPPVGPVRSSAVVPTINPYDARHQRQMALYQDAPPPPPLSLRNPSPSKQPPANVSPSSMIASPYTSMSTAGALGTASLNDFANVPKGPARMRERERERERDVRDVREFRDIRERDRTEEREFREPIPPPRDWDQRDRDWDREREREYLERDYRRDRSHSFDRRRLEDDDDRIEYTPTRSVPPFVPRGGMGGGVGRGGFAPGRGTAPWAGRARTRGRGSRGAWR